MCDWEVVGGGGGGGGGGGREGERVKLAFLVVPVVPCSSEVVFMITADLLHAHWLIFTINKWTDT